MDEYKQLKDSLNKLPIQRRHEQNFPQQLQGGPIAPESPIHNAQQSPVLEELHKDEPNHGVDHQDHQDHQDMESRVLWGSLGFWGL